MNISVLTGAYDAGRYSKPWIARVSFESASRIRFDFFGEWRGDEGCVGLLEIEAAAGDLVEVGQLNNRGPCSDPGLYLVEPDGSLSAVSRAEAYRLSPRRDQLVEERAALVARIAQIDEELEK